MSAMLNGGTNSGLNHPEYGLGKAEKRAGIWRSIAWCLTSGQNAGMGGGISHAGVAHTFAVCMLELEIMARGKAKGNIQTAVQSMPRFVDVKLSSDQKKAFADWFKLGGDRLIELQKFVDSGYRVGVAWSGEHQSYTVSVTCRDVESENNGLCMTSFARDLRQAVALAWYKHEIVCSFAWQSFASGPDEDFG